MGDKDAEGLLAAFEPHLAHVVCTQNSTERAMPAAELAEVAVEVYGEDRVTVEPRLADAIDEAAGAGRGRGRARSIGAGGVLSPARSSPSARPGRCCAGDGRDRPGAQPRAVARAAACAPRCSSLEAITLGLTTPVLITVADVDTAGRAGRRARAGGAVPADRRDAAQRVGLRARLAGPGSARSRWAS